MGIKQIKMALSVLIMFSILLHGYPAYSAQPAFIILGDVIASGSAEMQIFSDKWMSIGGKSSPLTDGTRLRTGEGSLHITLSEQARLEVGKNSELTVFGSRGNYVVNLDIGSIVFNVASRVDFTITTPSANIQVQPASGFIQKVALDANGKDRARGIVTYDGKATTVISESGTFIVKDMSGISTQTVSAGKSAYIAKSDSNPQYTPVQLLAETVVAPTMSHIITGAALIGGVGVTAFIVNSATRKAISPSRP